MKNISILLILFLILGITFFSGCTSSPDWNDPLGIETAATNSTAICGIVIIIVVILVVVLLVGLARAGTKKDITIHTPTVQPTPQTVVVHHESKDLPKTENIKSERRCPECGHVIPHDAKLCPYCGKKFKVYFEEERNNEAEIAKSSINIPEKEQRKIIQKLKFCPQCGQKLSDSSMFCPKCGVKLEED